MAEINKHILKNAIDNLPESKAPNAIWELIDEDLENASESNKECLTIAIDDLPEYKITRDLWNNIESEFKYKPDRKVLTVGIMLKIAASIVMLIGLSISLLHYTSKNYQVEISTTIIIENSEEKALNLTPDPEIASEIELLCSNLPEQCKGPLVKELKQQLDEVTKQYNAVKETMNKHKTPDFNRYLDRLENEKTEIEKELLNIIINS